MISGIIESHGPDVMKNFIANVAQNRTIPVATQVIQTTFDEIAAERIMQIVDRNPALISRLFGPQDEIPGMAEMLRRGGQPSTARNPLTELAETLHSGDPQTASNLSSLVRQRLRAAAGDADFVRDMSESLSMAETADSLGVPNISNPLYELSNLLDAIDENHAFRSMPSMSAGKARSPTERYHRDLEMGDSSANDPLVSVYELLEEAGTPPDEIFQSLSRRLHIFDTDPNFSGEGNLAPFMDPDALVRETETFGEGRSAGGIITPPPDPALFLRTMGLR